MVVLLPWREKMKKNIIKLGIILALSTPVFSAEGLSMRGHLIDSINQKPRMVAYMKDVVIGVPNKDEIMADIISPNETHHGLNFKEILKQTFNVNYWMPTQTVFADQKMEELFRGYESKVKDIDDYNIFLANLLYVAGNQYYDQTKNSEFLEYAASIGHADAQYKMFSIKIKENKPSEAKNYLLSAAAQKNSEALLKLSNVYQGDYSRMWGNDFPRDLDMSRKLCQESANLGNHEAVFMVEVAPLTEGYFGSIMNYQEGIQKAKDLSVKENKRAQEFINAIMHSSGDALMEGNEAITYADLNFLREYLGWKDETD